MQSLITILGSGLDGSIDTAFGTMLAEALLVVGLLLMVVLVYCASLLQLQVNREIDADKYGNGYDDDDESGRIVESRASDIPALVVPAPLGSAVDGVPLLSPLLLVDRVARRHNRDGVRRLTVREAIAGVPDEYADTAIDERPTQMTQALTPALSFPAHPTIPEDDQFQQEQREQREQLEEWAPSVIVSDFGHLIEMRMRPLSRENLN